ncbi:MAG: thioredoxin domain-containing protein [Candidatus Sungbacteria bacterium]|nr:thioredoxin domain-containing protein [Candidatus Sungbacteria bacterium]
MRRIIFWLSVFVFIGGAVFGMVKLLQNSSGGGGAALISAVFSGDNMKGSKESKVVLVEYSDFQCPACAAYYPLVKEAAKEFADDAQFVYRHFPLSQIHRNAELAARAAEAAGRQGKFWEMHDIIFEKQSEWASEKNARELFRQYAETLGLDLERFSQDIDSSGVISKVADDYRGGFDSGVNSTPTFFLNGQKLQNPRSYDEFRTIIRKAIEQNP